MCAKIVTIDNRKIIVYCCPDTPLSEVLKRAARAAMQLEKENEK